MGKPERSIHGLLIKEFFMSESSFLRLQRFMYNARKKSAGLRLFRGRQCRLGCRQGGTPAHG